MEKVLPIVTPAPPISGSNCSQKFTSKLLTEFILSRPQGTAEKSIGSYHYTLDNFVGYPLTSQGISSYLTSLTCKNGKAKFYSCLRALSRWLYNNSYIETNIIEKVSPPKIQRKLLPAISKAQLEVLERYCLCERDRVILNLLWYSGMRLSEAANIKAKDFNWQEGTVVILGKGNRFRKALAGNGVVRKWFSSHDSFEISPRGIQVMLQRLGKATGIHCNPHSFRRGFCVHQVKSGLSNKVIQSLGGWETPDMVSHYAASLTFDDALRIYRRANGVNRT